MNKQERNIYRCVKTSERPLLWLWDVVREIHKGGSLLSDADYANLQNSILLDDEHEKLCE